jgi:hypothetical protein
MQDPKPPITKALKDFYGHYESGNVPSDDVIEGMAKEWAGREGELWSQLYGHYEKSGVGEDVINQLVVDFENPFSKKKSPGGEGSSPSGGAEEPLVVDQQPVTEVPGKSGLNPTVAGALIGTDKAVEGEENDEGIVARIGDALSNWWKGDLTVQMERGESNIEAAKVVTPELLVEDPAFALLRFNDARGSNARDYLAETDDPIEAAGIYVRTLGDLNDVDKRRVKDFEAANPEEQIEAFEKLKETLGPQRAQVRELQAVIEAGQDPAQVQQAQMELETILSDEGYQQGEQLYQSYIEDFGFGEYQAAIERMYASQIAHQQLKEEYPEFFAQIEEQQDQQELIDRMSAAGLRPNRNLPGAWQPEVLRFGDFSFYQQIEAPFTRQFVEGVKSIAATPGIVMSAFGADKVGADWARTVNRLVETNELIPISSNVQRGVRETVGKIKVDGADYQVVVEGDEAVGVRNADGYLVFGDQRNRIIEEWNASGGTASKQMNWGMVLPIMSGATAQIAMTIAGTRLMTPAKATRLQSQIAGTGTMTAQLANQQYLTALDEVGVENADLAARYAMSSALLMSSVNLMINPIEAGISTSIGRESARAMARRLNAAGPNAAYQAGIKATATNLARKVAGYGKGVVQEGIEGLAEQGVDVAIRSATKTSLSPTRQMDVDASLDAFTNAFIEEALGSMFVNLAMAPRAPMHKEVLYRAYTDKPEVLERLAPDAKKHYSKVFEQAHMILAGQNVSDPVKAEVLASVDQAVRQSGFKGTDIAGERSLAAQNYAKGVAAAVENGTLTDESFEEGDRVSLEEIENSRVESQSPIEGYVVENGAGQELTVTAIGGGKVTFTDGVQEVQVDNATWAMMMDQIHDARLSRHQPSVKKEEAEAVRSMSRARMKIGGRNVKERWDNTDPGDWSLEDQIANFFIHGGRAKTSSYDEHGDPVRRKETPGMTMNYLGQKGESLDMIAEQIMSESPTQLDEGEVIQAIVDFMESNPGGAKSYANQRIKEMEGPEDATVQEVIDEYNGDIQAVNRDLDEAEETGVPPNDILMRLTPEAEAEIRERGAEFERTRPLTYRPAPEGDVSDAVREAVGSKDGAEVLSELKAAEEAGTYEGTAYENLSKEEIADLRARVGWSENDANPEAVANIANATGAKVVVHRTEESLPEVLQGKPYSAVYDMAENTIHINSSLADETTAAHEGVHVLLRDAPPEVITALYDQLVGLRGGKKMIEYAKGYGDPTNPDVQEEAIAEYMAKVVAGEIKPSRTVWQRIVEFFGKLGFNVRSTESLLGLANDYVQAVKTGEPMVIPFDKVTGNKRTGFKFQVPAWHGSPHEFDKFSTSAMGTGEGAQAFGWGLYFTTQKDIAEYYNVALSTWDVNNLNSIDTSNLNGDPKSVFEQFISEERHNVRMGVSDGFRVLSGDELVSRFSEWIELTFDVDRVSDWFVGNVSDPIQGFAEKFRGVEVKPGGYTYEATLHEGKEPGEYKWLDWVESVPFEDFKRIVSALPDVADRNAGLFMSDLLGSSLKDVYELHDEVAYLLLTESVPGYKSGSGLGNLSKAVEQDMRDAGLLDGMLYGEVSDAIGNYVVGAILGADVSALSPATRKVVKSLRNKDDVKKVFSEDNYKGVKGSVFYQYLSKVLGGDKEASLFLLDNGIDGNKYPAQSMGAGDYSKGTNYVVFDEDAVTVKQRYKFQKKKGPSGDQMALPEYNPYMEAAMAEARKHADKVSPAFLIPALQSQFNLTKEQAEVAVKAATALRTSSKPPLRKITDAFFKVRAALGGKERTTENTWIGSKLLPSQGLDGTPMRANEFREGTVNRVTTLAIRKAKEVDKALQASDITDVRTKFDAYLRGDTAVASELGQELVGLANEMRAHVDSITQALIDEGHVGPVQRQVLMENLGSYLTRAYRIHTDPDYTPADKIKNEWINKESVRLYMQKVKAGIDPKIAREEALYEAERRMNDILKDNAKDNPFGGGTVSKNMGIMRRRQQLPAEIEGLVEKIIADPNPSQSDIDRVGELLVGNEINYAKKRIPKGILRNGVTKQDVSDMLDGKTPANTSAEAREWVRAQQDDAVAYADRATKALESGEGAVALGFIDKETRALLGEFTDPTEAYLYTVFQTARHLAASRYLQTMLIVGDQRFIWDENDTTRPKEGTVKFAAEGSRTLAPLNGKYVLEEYSDYLKQLDIGVNQDWGWFLNGLKKIMQTTNYNKTVLSLGTQIKNFIGGVAMNVANGNIPLLGMNKVVGDVVGGKTSDFVSKLEYLGLVGDSVSARALREAFNNRDPEGRLRSYLEKGVVNKAKKIARIPTVIYSATDDVFKASAFITEANSYAWAMFGKKYKDLTRDEMIVIDQHASEVVKNTYPNYSRLGRFMKGLSVNLFYGNFIGFMAESLRTEFNILSTALADIRSSNNRVKLVGARRLAGYTAFGTTRVMVANAALKMAGLGMHGLLGAIFDDDEEEDRQAGFRKLLYDWEEAGDFITIDFQDGDMSYVYMTGSDPYGARVKAMNAVLEAEDFNQASADFFTEFVGGFFDQTIWLDAYNSIVNNEDVYGQQIWGSSDSWDKALRKTGEYVFRTLGPGTYNSYLKVAAAEEADTANELWGQITGFKYRTDRISKRFNSMHAYRVLGRKGVVGDARQNAQRVYADAGYEAALAEFKERAMPELEELRETYLQMLELGAPLEEMQDVIKGHTAKSSKSMSYFLNWYIQSGQWMDPPIKYFE